MPLIIIENTKRTLVFFIFIIYHWLLQLENLFDNVKNYTLKKLKFKTTKWVKEGP
jgi:hypothetical protein